MKRIWITGMIAIMLAGNCLPSQAKGSKVKDGVLGAFSTFAENSSGGAQVTSKGSMAVSKSYNQQAVQNEWNEEEYESAEKANELIYEGETVWLNTDAGFYQSLAGIVRDIAYYYNGTYDLDLDLDHPFDRKDE